MNFMKDFNRYVGASHSVFGNTKQTPIPQAIFNEVEARRYQQRKSGLRGAENYDRWLSDRNQRMTGLARYVAQKPYGNMKTITNALLAHLENVQHYLAITNPLTLDTASRNSIKGRFDNFNRLFSKLHEILKSRPALHLDYITSGVNFGLNE